MAAIHNYASNKLNNSCEYFRKTNLNRRQIEKQQMHTQPNVVAVVTVYIFPLQIKWKNEKQQQEEKLEEKLTKFRNCLEHINY